MRPRPRRGRHGETRTLPRQGRADSRPRPVARHPVQRDRNLVHELRQLVQPIGRRIVGRRRTPHRHHQRNAHHSLAQVPRLELTRKNLPRHICRARDTSRQPRAVSRRLRAESRPRRATSRFPRATSRQPCAASRRQSRRLHCQSISHPRNRANHSCFRTFRPHIVLKTDSAPLTFGGKFGIIPMLVL